MIGDRLLVTDTDYISVMSLASLDLANGRGTVVDTSAINPAPLNVAVRDFVPKVFVTVPFIGYLMMATQRIEGMVILGLIGLFLVILYIIAELWKHSPEPEEDMEDEIPNAYVKSKNELKKEEKARRRMMEEEEARARQQEKMRRKSRDGKIRTGGFVDEVDESDFEDDDPYENVRYAQDHVANATSEAHEELRKEIAAATAQSYYQELPVRKEKEEPYSSSRSRHKSARPKSAQARRPKPVVKEEQEGPAEYKRLAIPRYSVDDLTMIAKQAGDSPDVVKDEITDVTLFDYSDMFAAEDTGEDES
jgi:hypothetical protein